MGKPSDFSKIRHLIFVENRENIVLPIPVPQLRSISLHLCASLWHPEHLCGNDRWNVFNNLQKTYIFSASSKISPILELKIFLLCQMSLGTDSTFRDLTENYFSSFFSFVIWRQFSLPRRGSRHQRDAKGVESIYLIRGEKWTEQIFLETIVLDFWANGFQNMIFRKYEGELKEKY